MRSHAREGPALSATTLRSSVSPTSPLACCWIGGFDDWPFWIEPPIRDMSSSDVVNSGVIT